MRRGGSVKRYAAGGATETNQYGSIPALDDGGGVPDPGGAIPTDPSDPGAMQDTGQGQAGQAGDLSGALGAVQQAYQYGMQMLTGNSSPQFMGGNTQVQPSGPQVNGQPSWSEEDQANLDSTNNALANGMIQKTGPGLMIGKGASGIRTAAGMVGNAISPAQAQQPQGGDYTAPAQARGGSVPAYQGGSMAVPAAGPPQPQQPTPAPRGGGVGGSVPPQIMRYLTGADAAPIPQVMRTMQSMQGHGRAARTVASGQTPQQRYAILQALRKLSDTAGTHAKVSLSGNGKIPASLQHAVMFANKKFEYTPSPFHISFAVKGQKKPTQQAARGGSIQSFQGAGSVASTGDPNMDLAIGAGAPAQTPSSDQNTSGFGATTGGPAEGEITPITMNVQNPQNGQSTSVDVPSSVLGGLIGNTFDEWVSKPAATIMNSLKQEWANIKEAANPYQSADYSPPGSDKTQNYTIGDAIQNIAKVIGGGPGSADFAGMRFDKRTIDNNVPFPGPAGDALQPVTPMKAQHADLRSVQKQDLPPLSPEHAPGGNPNLGNTISFNPMTGERTYVPIGKTLAQQSKFYQPPKGGGPATQIGVPPGVGGSMDYMTAPAPVATPSPSAAPAASVGTSGQPTQPAQPSPPAQPVFGRRLTQALRPTLSGIQGLSAQSAQPAQPAHPAQPVAAQKAIRTSKQLSQSQNNSASAPAAAGVAAPEAPEAETPPAQTSAKTSANDYVRVGPTGIMVHRSDIAKLKQNPQIIAPSFDAMYGPGAAQAAMGG